MSRGVMVIGLLNVLIGGWVLFGTWLTMGGVTWDVGSRLIEENFWAISNFLYSVMIPAAICLILTGIALMYIGSERR